MNARTALPILLALLPLAACAVKAQDSTTGSSQTQTQSQSQLSRSVRVIRAKTGTLSVTRSASATIEPLQESQVSAGTTGQVKQILARSGAQVKAGQVVIQLDDDALQLQLDNAQLSLQTARVNLQSAERSSGLNTAQSDAGLQAAQTGLTIAKQRFTEGQSLLAAGGISQNDFDQLKVGLEQAQTTLLQAQAAADQSQRAPEEDLELLRLQVQQAQTQVAQAQQSLADAKLTAPYAGEVAEVLVEEGEFIGAGSPAFRLVSTDRQLASFSVAPEDAQRLLQQGRIWLPYNGLDYAAQVTQTSQTQGGRLVEVQANIYPSDTPIPNGTVTQFDYQLVLAKGILIPSGALRQNGGQVSVLVAQGGRAREVRVNLLSEGGAQVAVSGLSEGARVIYPLPADLNPGTPVEVLGEGQTNATTLGGGV